MASTVRWNREHKECAYILQKAFVVFILFAYVYIKASVPNLADYDANDNLVGGIEYGIAASTMVNKSMIDLTWNNGILIVNFNDELNNQDLAIMDQVVAQY